ncbi:uncharacterized protein V6R79_003774 [Siganus canaliculatus]
MADTVICGGYSDPAPATSRIRAIADQVKAEVEKTIGKNLLDYEAILFRQQVVAGMNYIIKIHVGHDECIHILVFEQLQCYGGNVEFIKVEQLHTRDDPLKPLV